DNVEMLMQGSAYWGKYVTNVKQNMDISTTPYVQIYTHLKSYEPHAKKTLKKQEQSTSIVDPLAYLAHTTSAPVLSSPSTPSPQPTAQSENGAVLDAEAEAFLADVECTAPYDQPQALMICA
ncbi:hypothetical protein Tco_0372472, partial [Tanacetum coccineum]